MIAEIPASPAMAVDLSAIEKVDRAIEKLPPTESEVINTFTPGLMTRRWFGAAGSRHRSKIHKSCHQFVILQGACMVRTNDGDPQLFVAPYHGITQPGTWRDIFVIMDSVWLTMHPTDKKTVAEVEADIIQSMEDVK